VFVRPRVIENAADRTCALRLPPAGQGGRLSDPGRHPRLVKIVLVDVNPACLPGLASRWSGSQRRTLEKGHLHVVRERMEAEKPAPALDAIKGRVPFDRLAHA